MKTILDYLKISNSDFIAPCNGNKSCGKCKVKISNRIIKPNDDDYRLLNKEDIKAGYRLACAHEYLDNDKIILHKVNEEVLKKININTRINNNWQCGYGIIIDIGTTTVVIKWIELTSGKEIHDEAFFNPQKIYGSDVISRINHDSNDNNHILHQLIKDCIIKKINQVNLNVELIIVVGNTTMIHLFLGLPVEMLGKVPFSIYQKDSTLSILETAYQQIRTLTLPHISAYVGSDIVSGIIASDIDQSNEYKMLIDLGTNGEIVICNKDKIFAASTAAGPAFEGVNIDCGGPSINGAISKVKIANDQIELITIGNKEATSICGSGLISIISELRRNKLIDEMGRFVNKQNRYYLTKTIYLSNKDIQAFQLAKAAIQTGINLIIKEVDKIDKIYISGGFGSHIEVEDLIELKIIDKKYQNCIEFISNSALSGAYVTLLNQDLKRAKDIVVKATTINLASHPDFNDELLDSLYF